VCKSNIHEVFTISNIDLQPVALKDHFLKLLMISTASKSRLPSRSAGSRNDSVLDIGIPFGFPGEMLRIGLVFDKEKHGGPGTMQIANVLLGNLFPNDAETGLAGENSSYGKADCGHLYKDFR
jgi:hypothetical protein